MDLTFGMYQAWGIAYFKGELDEIRIWNSVRSQSQIQDYMCRTLENPLNETNLIGYWRLDEGSGQVAHDLSGHNHTVGWGLPIHRTMTTLPGWQPPGRTEIVAHQ